MAIEKQIRIRSCSLGADAYSRTPVRQRNLTAELGFGDTIQHEKNMSVRISFLGKS